MSIPVSKSLRCEGKRGVTQAGCFFFSLEPLSLSLSVSLVVSLSLHLIFSLAQDLGQALGVVFVRVRVWPVCLACPCEPWLEDVSRWTPSG